MKKGLFLLFFVIVIFVGCAHSLLPEQEEVDTRKVKVMGMLALEDDPTYYDVVFNGLIRAEKNLDIELELTIVGRDIAEWKEQLRRVSQGDSELIVVAGGELPGLLEPVASAFPDKKYIILDTQAYGSNINSILFKQNESSYLVGALAGLMTESNIIGIVAGTDGQALQDFIIGYIQGATDVNPDCKVEVSILGGFTDVDKAKRISESQFEKGADIVFAAAGTASRGCIEAAYENGFYAIGVDADQAMLMDQGPDSIVITSGIKNLDVTVYRAIRDYINGELEFGAFNRLGLKEGAVRIVKNTNYIRLTTDNIREQIDDIEEKIINDEIKVKSALEMTTREFEELVALVKP